MFSMHVVVLRLSLPLYLRYPPSYVEWINIYAISLNSMHLQFSAECKTILYFYSSCSVFCNSFSLGHLIILSAISSSYFKQNPFVGEILQAKVWCMFGLTIYQNIFEILYPFNPAFCKLNFFF